MARTRTRRGKGRSRRKRGGFLGSLFGSTEKNSNKQLSKPTHSSYPTYREALSDLGQGNLHHNRLRHQGMNAAQKRRDARRRLATQDQFKTMRVGGGKRKKSMRHRKGTRKGMRRKTARRAYMKRHKTRKH